MATIARVSSPTQEFAHTFEEIPQVTKVFVANEGTSLTVWTVVDNFARHVRDRIYDIERDIFSRYPGTKFDFHVVPDNDGMISDAELIYVR
jgi:hypothetical protein